MNGQARSGEFKDVAAGNKDAFGRNDEIVVCLSATDNCFSQEHGFHGRD
jgi:hypothetical protein